MVRIFSKPDDIIQRGSRTDCLVLNPLMVEVLGVANPKRGVWGFISVVGVLIIFALSALCIIHLLVVIVMIDG